MRALREIIGGLSLALLTVLIVIGGLWLALTETGSTQRITTAVIANTSLSPTTAPPTLVAAPSLTASKSPVQPTPAGLGQAATPTRTSTATPTTLASTPTRTPPLPPTQTALPSPTRFACFPPPTWVQYTIAPGDTLFQLSLRFGVSPLQLQNANCLPSTKIKFNQIIYVPFIPSATVTVTASATPTATAIPNPLQINSITLISVQTDGSRPNGAIATLFLDFSGGRPPYTLYNDNQPQLGNPFEVLTDCNGTLLHTLRVLSADGQSVEYPYYYSPVICP